ncbi:MAG: TetR/AcrR family transcriptional regulator C-terminal domain-containing protein [Actinomycetota bacterium]
MARSGADPRNPRGRPRAASLEQIVDAAVEIGLDRLTLAAVAERLGIGTTTLYSYVPSSEALSIAVASRLLADFEPKTEASWDAHDVLVRFGIDLRELLVAHPGLVDVFARSIDLPAIADDVERRCALLIDRGLPPRTAVLLHGEVAVFVIAFESVRLAEEENPTAAGPILAEAIATTPEFNRDQQFRWALPALVTGLLASVDDGVFPWTEDGSCES